MKSFFGWILYIIVCLVILIGLSFASYLFIGHFAPGAVIAIVLVIFLGRKFPARKRE